MNNVKKRSLLGVYLLSIFTFGLYFFYWHVVTKEEINSLGGDIPTAFLLIIPIANLYWLYKYCEDYATYVKKNDDGLMYFILFVILPIIEPAIVQSGLNDLSNNKRIDTYQDSN